MWPTGDDCDDVDDDVTTKMKTSMLKLQIMMIMTRTSVLATMKIGMMAMMLMMIG